MRHTSPSTTEIYLHNDTEKQETGIAQQLYNLYHGNAGTDSRATLEQLINRMNAGQIAQLAGIAAAMA
jgi:GH24 family phage-related lysozyme (muramidase)